MLTFRFSTPRLAAAWALAVMPPAPVRPEVPERWVYSGDSDLEHGGVFIDISTWNDGYCDAVRVADLGSAIGFYGAMLIEHMVISIDSSERMRAAVASCGDYSWCGGTGDPAVTKASLRHMIAEALLRYGHADPDDSWDNYQSSYSETVQTDPDGEMSFDGWRADSRFAAGDDLFTYVVENHLQN